MLLERGAEIALIVFVFIFGATTAGLLFGLVFALKKMEQQVDKLTQKIDPVILKASHTLDSVQRVTVTVGEKADQILTRGEALTETVSQNVEKTASVVQTTVTTPLINLSSLITGVSKGFSVWSHAAAHPSATNGNGRVKTSRQE
jgi:predicted PurR-regulated permease PerM